MNVAMYHDNWNINVNLNLDGADVMQLLTDEEIDNCETEEQLVELLKQNILDMINR